MTDHITKIREALDAFDGAVHEVKVVSWNLPAQIDALSKADKCLADAIRSLLAALDEAQKDAKRYRYLREFGKHGFLLQFDPRRQAHGRGALITSVPHSGPGDYTPEKMDASIDAAIAAQEGGKDG